MKLSPKMRIIALCAVLVLVIAAGIFILTRDSAAPEEPVSAENTPDSPAGQTTDDTSQPTTVSEPPMIYVEEQLATSDTWPYLYSIYRYSGGGAVYNNGQMLDIVTQDVICDVPQEWLSTYGEDNYAFAFDEDDRLYLAAYDPEQGMLIISKDDAGQDVLLPLPEWIGGPAGTEIDLDNLTIEKLMVDSDYIYLLSRAAASINLDYTLQVFTRDGTLHTEYYYVVDFDTDGAGSLFYAQWGDESQAVFCFDIASDDMLYKAWGDSTSNMIYRHVTVDREGHRVYASTTERTHVFDSQSGDLLDTAMEMAYVRADLGSQWHHMYAFPDGGLYTTVMERLGGCSLYSYTLEPDAQHNIPYTLTITAPYYDEFMVQAIHLYEMDNPDQHILYDYAYNSIYEYKVNSYSDKYFDRLNLEILAGTVGDIVVTGFDNNDGHYDPYPYLRSDLFTDLTDMLKSSPLYDELDKVALDGISINGAVRGLPVGSSYYYAEVNLDLCEQLGIEMDWQNVTWSDLFSLVDQLEGTDYVLFDDYAEPGFIERILVSNMPDLFDREAGTFDLRQDWFIDLLNQWKNIQESPHFTQFGFDVAPTNALINLKGYTFRQYDIDLALRYVHYNTANRLRIQIVPMFCGELHPNRMAIPTDLYSISAWSEKQDEAWDFLSFMLSDQVQNLYTMLSRPLNEAIRNTRLEEAIQGYSEADLPRAQQFVQEMQNVYASVDTLYGMEELLGPMGRLARGYVYGAETLDEALATCERELRLIMDES